MNKNIKQVEEIIIYDCDGVLLDSSHRVSHIEINGKKVIDLEHWRENEHKTIYDEILPTVKKYWEDLKNLSKLVIICTAREVKPLDKGVIKQKIGYPDILLHRDLGCNKSTMQMKIEKINVLIDEHNLHGKPIKIYEDNIDNLKYLCDNFQCEGVYIPSKQGF